MRQIARLIYDYSQSNEIRQIVAKILGDFSFVKDNDPKVPEKIFYWIKENIKYIPDTKDVEILQTPDRTLKNGFGDCDDFVILYGSMLRSIGYDIGLVSVQVDWSKIPDVPATASNDYNHIFLIIKVNNEKGFVWGDLTLNEFDKCIPDEYIVKRYILFF